ncbi:alpha-amylase [Algoriphagus sp. H41]|uniref:Alpha-amylase n=1 Tax=Algoriphagus oliviformis TaxID=2811231 RepID=A0ABS3BZK9_9BACT|nr:alpha-amylase family glycosyl hydrolase [Algoriphagus oliviformis]MBN7810293.1 alpha-amylase [Algoriphagus oliviformis]
MKPPKIVLYHVFTRLFGNKNTRNKPWGTREENGVGKFADFTDLALEEIRKLGVTHIWYTGVLHHAMVGDFPEIGLQSDHPAVVKGRAGSPYAIRDYYQVNPDLVTNPSRRLEEFEELIARTHRHGMKVIIDLVPNHVSRHYEGRNNPAGTSDFGAEDDTSVAYARDNNFYYIPGKAFEIPDPKNGYQPLGGEAHSLLGEAYREFPAKWTGNGSRNAKPDFYDWYETAKINYGLRPDGSKDFPELPIEAIKWDWTKHLAFWKEKEVPDTWRKFRDIAFFWLEKNVDGFRYDMAEMVPVEFWSYLNSHIKSRKEDAFLVAEVYNPGLYRDFIFKGKVDYLYDKVGLYDALKEIVQGHGSTDKLVHIQQGLKDIEHHMLHFLENHDEVRIASPEFAVNPWKAMPAMVVSALIGTSPTMIYFGQEVGEPAREWAGFGHPNRTSIFDYIGVPQHQKWMNGGKFDGGQLTDNEKALRNYHSEVLNFSVQSPALRGEYRELHTLNRHHHSGYGSKQFAFARWGGGQQLLVVCNFDEHHGFMARLKIPKELVALWHLAPGTREVSEVMFGKKKTLLRVHEQEAFLELDFGPLESAVFEVGR